MDRYGLGAMARRRAGSFGSLGVRVGDAVRRPRGVAIHASTTPRARETAALIGSVLGLAVTEEPGLRVPDPGAAEGQRWESARATWRADPDNPTRPAAAGAEAWTGYLDRATATVARLLDRHPSGALLLVGHSETLAAIFHLLLSVSTLGRLKVAFDHCAVPMARHRRMARRAQPLPERWSLEQHNDTSRLTGPAML